MNKKRKIILASILGITTSVLALGNLVGNKLAKDEEFFIIPPPPRTIKL